MDANERTAIIRRRAFELARSIVHFLEVTDPVSSRSLQSPIRQYAGRTYGTLQAPPNSPQAAPYEDSISSNFNATLPTTSTPKKYVSRLSTSPRRYPVQTFAPETLQNSSELHKNSQNKTVTPNFVTLDRDKLHWTSLAHSPTRNDMRNRRFVSPDRRGGAVDMNHRQRQVGQTPIPTNNEIKRTSSKRTIMEVKPDGTRTQTVIEQDVTFLDQSERGNFLEQQSPTVTDSGVRSYQPYSRNDFSPTSPHSLEESVPAYSSCGGYHSPNFTRQRTSHSPTRETPSSLQSNRCSIPQTPSPIKNSCRSPNYDFPSLSQRSPNRSPVETTPPLLNFEEEEALDNLVDITLQGFSELAKSMREEVEQPNSINTSNSVRKLNKFLVEKLVKSEKSLKDLQEDIDDILAEMSCIIVNRPISPENIQEMRRAIREEVSKMSEVSIYREEGEETPRKADRPDSNPLRQLNLEKKIASDEEESILIDNTAPHKVNPFRELTKQEDRETNDAADREKK